MIQANLFPLNEAADHLPRRRGRKVNYSTVWRWATRGCRGRRLATVLVGGIRYTSEAAIEQFFSAGGPELIATKHATDQRSAAVVRAERQLDVEGI